MELNTRKGDQGLFDELFAWIERLRNTNRYVYGLEEHVFALEGVLQDIDTESVTRAVTSRLEFWFEVVEQQDGDEDAIAAFQANAITVLTVLARYTPNTVNDVISVIKNIPPVPPEDWRPKVPLDKDRLNALYKALKGSIGITYTRNHFYRLVRDFTDSLSDSQATSASMLEALQVLSASRPSLSLMDFFDCFRTSLAATPLTTTSPLTPNAVDMPAPVPLTRIESDEERRRKLVSDAKFLWKIRVRFTDHQPSASVLSESIWLLTTALESINGVHVVLEEWGSGSRFAKLWVYIKNVWAKDVVQDVLGKGREAAMAHYLDKPAEEVEKLRAERAKIDEERAAIRAGRESKGSAEHQEELRAIELETKRADLYAKKLDNQIKALEAVEKASVMASKGLIKADKVEIDINELFYFLCNGKEVQSGTEMRRIDQAMTVLRDDDVPPDDSVPVSPPSSGPPESPPSSIHSK